MTFAENNIRGPGSWTQERLSKIPEYKERIVELTRRGMFLSEISIELDISTEAMRNWRAEDRNFKADYAEAHTAWIDQIEKEATRRAFQGVADVIVHAGKVVMDPRTMNDPDGPKPLLKRVYSDNLMMFILKGHRREVFGDKVETDNTHRLDLTGARETLAAKLLALTARLAEPGPGESVEPGGESV